MKVLIAPDSFKDCLEAADVARYLGEGIRRVIPDAEITSIPVADGGEGFVQTMLSAMGGEKIITRVFDPLMRDVDAFYGILPDGTAVIEMAAASGIEHLKREERNPLITTTIGTGQLMLNAMERGCRKIIIGIGGSATNDGGVGMARALGYRFLDKDGMEVPPGGGSLSEIQSIDFSKVNPLMGETAVWVACDVNNPLIGPRGASAVYGPQKGATPELVERLDSNLEHLAKMIKKYLNIDVLDLAGGGAAGGLGAGLVAFAGGRLQAGFDIVKEQSHLEEAVKVADIVLTGEGKMDGQTKQGKTPWGVAQLAQKYGKPLFAFAGFLGDGYRELYDEGFTSIFALPNGPASLDACIANAPELLADTAEQVFRVLKLPAKS
ncbi:glycerate kinase [Mangrovibacterium diazotrophicum]|uniref:Glycerate kinase n=1 Tax=Mangrovibacterium diazotrophicum TaxID=1261403 RepID=A0A419W9G9_9BACT|nr:glycerate kinase [Mangrovibacterium diazotrophicum]RKD92052.1 glycerate kinase [Mangrovibacterium diazotrophicum]